MVNYKHYVKNLAQKADIEINGTRPWDMQIHNESVYGDIFKRGTLGAGEAYVNGHWDCDQLDVLFEKALLGNLQKKTKLTPSAAILFVTHLLLNRHNITRSKKVAEQHYDLSNEFYEAMLDERMVYTCGYWKNAQNLDEAQVAKLDMVCQKLELEPDQKVLDIGCGWGSFAKYAAKKYNVHVTGVNISKEQVAYAKETCKDLPVEILLQDYRQTEGKFDRVVSLGMFEHVGWRNYKTYMDLVNSKLKDEGLFLLHTVGHRYLTRSADQWIDKYIFPNSTIPSIQHIGKATNKLFIMEDWHNFGRDYATTLEAWYQNFNQSWPQFENQLGPEFYRMWKYYLLSFVGAFRARHMNLWQIVLSKRRRPQIYRSIRP